MGGDARPSPLRANQSTGTSQVTSTALPIQKMTFGSLIALTKTMFIQLMKPVDLVANAISHGSKSGGSVLDLFMGSGTTIIAC